ncbi:hypothetical protein CFC21_067574 [Triticum aestivum]|uniref:Uncharacterized protein n=4 Tax=Triticum TaxID=4564 RepID=A0A9R0WRW3_TRITD|nr:hypothetical protein TRIUR3_04179 [Triticum urartu]KAF7060821.1 hypothetical protein CFC21_067574 [Triticum aestivum]VAI21682.1 unnamed protein product [Triticum turgidum subsp. durum]
MPLEDMEAPNLCQPHLGDTSTRDPLADISNVDHHFRMTAMPVQGTADTIHDDEEHNMTSSIEKRDIINARRRAAYKEKKEKEDAPIMYHHKNKGIR